MVIKGPVASAGSILNLCNMSGINVPKIAAYIITMTNDIESVIENIVSLIP